MGIFLNFTLSFLSLFGQTAGWTSFTDSADTRTIYVSSSMGNDANDGLSPATPKQTPQAGINLIRHTYPDHLLFKAGDTWNSSLGRWQKSGRSVNEKMLISYYGTGARPRFLTSGGAIWTNGGGGTPPSIDNLAIVGLYFTPTGYTGYDRCTGVEFLITMSRILIEDCVFAGYSDNIVLYGAYGNLSNIAVRRCIIIDSYYLGNGHSQGVYLENANGILLEENIINHNGWQQNNDSTATIFNHNIYAQNNNGAITINGNIIANGSSHGLQLRCGGTVNNNLFARNPISCLIGGGSNPNPGGVIAEARNNIIIDGKNINSSNPRGWALELSNIKNGNVIGNIISSNTNGTQPSSIYLYGDYVMKNVNFIDNTIYNWGPGPRLGGTSSNTNGLVWRRNNFQDFTSNKVLFEHENTSSTNSMIFRKNTFFRQAAPTSNWFNVGGSNMSLTQWQNATQNQGSTANEIHYVDANRSIGGYKATLGGTPTHDAFMQLACDRPLHTWPVELTAASVNKYIRDGLKQ